MRGKLQKSLHAKAKAEPSHNSMAFGNKICREGVVVEYKRDAERLNGRLALRMKRFGLRRGSPGQLAVVRIPAQKKLPKV